MIIVDYKNITIIIRPNYNIFIIRKAWIFKNIFEWIEFEKLVYYVWIFKDLRVPFFLNGQYSWIFSEI